jgi:hypothetical protein
LEAVRLEGGGWSFLLGGDETFHPLKLIQPSPPPISPVILNSLSCMSSPQTRSSRANSWTGLSTLHQQEGDRESGDQDVSVSGSEVRFVGFPGDSANVPSFLPYDRLVLLGLLLEANRVRALSFSPSFTTPTPPLASSVSSSC